jgi:4-hydroxybenzoate polyprenyltransferase
MNCQPQDPTTRRSIRRTIRLMIALILVHEAIIIPIATERFNIHGSLLYVLATLAALLMVAILLLLVVVGTQQRDEFQRKLFVHSIFVGTAVTIAITIVCGYLESVADFPRHLPTVSIFIIFFLTTGVANLALRVYNRAADE